MQVQEGTKNDDNMAMKLGVQTYDETLSKSASLWFNSYISFLFHTIVT